MAEYMLWMHDFLIPHKLGGCIIHYISIDPHSEGAQISGEGLNSSRSD